MVRLIVVNSSTLARHRITWRWDAPWVVSTVVSSMTFNDNSSSGIGLMRKYTGKFILLSLSHVSLKSILSGGATDEPSIADCGLLFTRKNREEHLSCIYVYIIIPDSGFVFLFNTSLNLRLKPNCSVSESRAKDVKKRTKWGWGRQRPIYESYLLPALTLTFGRNT